MATITSLDELRTLVGDPHPQVATKERNRLDEVDREWLAASPLCFIATSNLHGDCDVSPRGDPPGFVRVLDDRTIVVPDRPGNRRVDSFRNILENPRVALIHVIPGRGDTLRIAGAARLVTDPAYGDEFVVKGHSPSVFVEVAVERVFYHCSRAILRGRLWKPDSWPLPDEVRSREAIARAVHQPYLPLSTDEGRTDEDAALY
jgi:uncharacterized protein